MATDRARRYGGIARLYGAEALPRLARARVVVAGIGGVGSWAAEALARSGVGTLVLVDLDHVVESNINRQSQALESTQGEAKVLAMTRRLQEIDAEICVDTVDDFVTPENAAEIVAGADVVIDAVDDMDAKLALVRACRAASVPLVICGGAGGKTRPDAVRCADLMHTTHDALLAKLRRLLRQQGEAPAAGELGVQAVYSVEPMRARQDGEACEAGARLACAGYGSCMPVTAAFGLTAASCALQILVTCHS